MGEFLSAVLLVAIAVGIVLLGNHEAKSFEGDMDARLDRMISARRRIDEVRSRIRNGEPATFQELDAAYEEWLRTSRDVWQ